MKKNATTGFIKSFLLFGIAFLLLVTTTPIGFLYALLRQLFSGKIKTLQIYFIVYIIHTSIILNTSHFKVFIP